MHPVCGFRVIRVTGDNVTTARAIAVECGIITSDQDLVIEGPVFRRMTPREVDAILPRLKVGHVEVYCKGFRHCTYVIVSVAIVGKQVGAIAGVDC